MDKKLSHSDIWDTHIKNIPLNLNPHCAKFTRPPPPPQSPVSIWLYGADKLLAPSYKTIAVTTEITSYSTTLKREGFVMCFNLTVQ